MKPFSYSVRNVSKKGIFPSSFLWEQFTQLATLPESRKKSRSFPEPSWNEAKEKNSLLVAHVRFLICFVL